MTHAFVSPSTSACAFDRILQTLFIAYLVVLPVSVAASNVLGVFLLIGAWSRPKVAWARLRACLPMPLLLALLCLPLVAGLASLTLDVIEQDTLNALSKHRKVMLLSLAPIICHSAVCFVRARTAVWVGSGILAVLTWVFMFWGHGLKGPFDPEVPVTITHTYQNYIVGFGAVWLGYWLVSTRDRAKSWPWYLGVAGLATMVGSVLFVVTGRAGQAAFALMAVIVVFGAMKRGRWLAAGAVVLVICSALAASPQARDRWLSVLDSFGGATSELAMPSTLRLYYLQHTVTIIGEAPWFGHGTARFDDVYERVSKEPRASLYFANHPHMDILLFWAEAGIAGLLAVLVLYVAMFRMAGRLPIEPRLHLSALTAGFIIGGLTHTFLLDYISGAYFYSIAGLLLSGPARGSTRPAEQPTPDLRLRSH